jgi:excisionase family DNA binding protein
MYHLVQCPTCTTALNHSLWAEQFNNTLNRKKRQMRNLQTIPQAVASNPEICVSTATVRRWVAEGRLRGYRSGPKRVLIDVDELADMVTPITPL